MDINLTQIGRTLISSSKLWSQTPTTNGEATVPCSDTASHLLEILDWHRISVSDEAWKPASEIRAAIKQTPEAAKTYAVAEWAAAVRGARQEAERVFVVMHLFAGPRRERDLHEYVEQEAGEQGLRLLMVSVDLLADAQWDLGDPSTFHCLMDLIVEGLIDITVGGPPCSTWSILRHRHLPGGPRPLRLRGRHAWGVPWLNSKERCRVTESNVLTLNALALCEGCSSRGGGHGIEHPADPGEDPFASIWGTPEVQEFEARTGSRRHILHQCMYGGPVRKPTCISGNLEGLDSEGRLCDNMREHDRRFGLNDRGEFRSHELARYPADLCRFLADCIVKTLCKFRLNGSGPTGWRRSTVPTVRVSDWSRRSTNESEVAVAVLNEDVVRGRSVVLRDKQAGAHLHVDDGAILCSATTPGLSHQIMHRSADSLERIGFQVKDRQTDGSLSKILGYEPRRHPARLSLPADKAILLIDSLRSLAGQRGVEVDELRSVTGVWIWGALLKRELLSVPQRLFGFIDRLQGQTVRWWPSARREVLWTADTVIAMHADLGAALPTTLFATDAMGASDLDHGGYGIVTCACPRGIVEQTFQEALEPGFSVTKLDGSFSGLKNPSLPITRTVPFTRVSDDVVNADWKPLAWGRWNKTDHITLGESRALVELLQVLANSSRCHRHRVISLQDNRPTVGAMNKGRSTAPALNFVCRQRCALTVASEIQVLLPWVEGPKMPADWLSRFTDPDYLGQDPRPLETASDDRKAGTSQQRRPASSITRHRPQG